MTFLVVVHPDLHDVAEEYRVGSRFDGIPNPADHVGAGVIEYGGARRGIRPHGATGGKTFIPIRNPRLTGERLGDQALILVEDIDREASRVGDQVV